MLRGASGEDCFQSFLSFVFSLLRFLLNLTHEIKAF